MESQVTYTNCDMCRKLLKNALYQYFHHFLNHILGLYICSEKQVYSKTLSQKRVVGSQKRSNDVKRVNRTATMNVERSRFARGMMEFSGVELLLVLAGFKGAFPIA